jgi:thymidylate synthase (FAD)
MHNKIDVLDKGYVRLVDVLGTDLTIANAARVSYDKQVEELSDKDERLIRFLAKHDHTSPFRHAMVQFEIYAPLMIARQWWKYVAGSDHTLDAWNESSRRYITEDEEFHVPSMNEWRSKPENSKQGSGPVFPAEIGAYWTQELEEHVENGQAKYKQAMDAGIAPEQARLFLPAYGLMVRWYWTGSLQSVSHLIRQRVKADAQYEFQEYAHAVKALTEQQFPVALNELLGGESS